MMEVFVAYTPESSLDELGNTLDAWEKAGLEPVAIECKKKKFELVRRVTAENLSRADYILAELGTEPVEFGFGEIASEYLGGHSDVGLVGAWRIGQTQNEWPNSVVVCRKGIVEKWPTPKTEFYIQEHVEAYRLAGQKALLCRQIHYRRTNKSLPS
ncbi:MAG TPA: hypothetical protein VF748_16125 [Candidatus Acidoferrum sp.]